MVFDGGEPEHEGGQVIDAQQLDNQWQAGPIEPASAIAQHVPGPDSQQLVAGGLGWCFALVLAGVAVQ